MLASAAAAARTRRARETSRRLWRLAPALSAAVLAVAAAVRWMQGPAAIPLTLLGAAAGVWLVYASLGRRAARLSDAAAAALDRDADLGGELRSAVWFASRGANDSWAGFHLGRAADRLEAVDFRALYPPVRARRARLATGAMAVAALAIVATFPQHPQADSRSLTPALASVPGHAFALDEAGVPPELPQDLEDLLASIENGTLSSRTDADAVAVAGTLAQLQALRDPKALAALARAMAAARATADDEAAMRQLADRARRDAAITPPSEIRDALEDLSKKLSEPGRESDSAALEKGDETQSEGGVDLAAPPSESSRDASAIAGVGMVTVSNQDAADTNGLPGSGVGGTSSSPGEAGTMARITSALRHEVIEANEDDVGGDVHSADRRRTDRGSATAAYTRGAAVRSDETRTAARPPVPEARRAGVQSYFIRKQ